MNMVNTPNFGCEAGAMDCLCPNVDFFNGIVDCAKSACNDGTVIAEDAAAAASNSAVAMCASTLDPSVLVLRDRRHGGN